MLNSRYYISRNYKATTNAASKPKMDCETVMATYGYKNLGFAQTNHPSSAVGAIISFLGITRGLLRLPFKSTFCMQYPLSKFYGYVTTMARLKGCKVLMVVHDVKSLMGKSKDIAKEMKKFNKADILILHNDAMIKWFYENGYKGKTVPLYLFDYLPEGKLPKMQAMEVGRDIVFAGGLGMEKSAFLYKIDGLPLKSFCFKLFGNGFQEHLLNMDETVLKYGGKFSPNEVMHHLKGNFGLVWNGDSITECSGNFGKYLLYNNPHKTSLYILAGLPIIIWTKAEMAKFVEREQIGLSIESLEELPEKIQGLSKERYEKILANVARVRTKLANGGYLTDALQQVEELV
ncbi:MULTISPECIES: beta-1,6-galactofuranosyltransferase [Flavobacteriaceae]|uniref:beta-1,6-galactofuranosyltransferase n=1 Tax=Flavobacteriaceae TaxID=49546 RepID=UPI001491686B|nr:MULTISPECIES: beta-1,6-galactofuranosyltransferase [Allomuricauda]MDC6367451.1 beta-1,6-galactofuranosyltransferase [Muricauda sp. AC10]